MKNTTDGNGVSAGVQTLRAESGNSRGEFERAESVDTHRLTPLAGFFRLETERRNETLTSPGFGTVPRLEKGLIMAAWIAGSVTFADPVGIAGAGGVNTGKYWHESVVIETPRYERRLFAYPGVDGLAVKSFGYRGRGISGRVIYAATSLNALKTTVETDRNTLANAVFSTNTPGGESFANCQLESLTDGPITATRDGLFLMDAHLKLLQLRS